MKRLIGLTALCALAGIGCGDDDGVDPMVDSGPVITIDGGPGVDAGPGVDSGPRMDSGMPTTTTIGTACDAVRGCAGPGETCYDEARFTNTTGGTGDPIAGDVPAEYASGYTSSIFPGGYCSVAECDFDMADTSCGPGATCVEVSDNFGLCLNNCMANSTDNSNCRDGYDCAAGLDVCFIGCQEIADCRIQREESNDIPGIQTPMDCSAMPSACGGTATNFDNLVWLGDAEVGDLDCNTDTFRCEFSGTAGAEAGDPCETDYDCEANGRCLADEPGDEPVWGDGFCTKISCNTPGRGCAGDAVCTDRRIGTDICVPTCTVGEGANPEDPATWLTNRGGCPEGQGCLWSGSAAATDNGYCFPVEYNPSVTVENVGATCTENTDCWSPFGEGSCFDYLFNDVDAGEPADFPNGYCSVIDCAAPGRGGENSCGEGNLCVGLGSDTAPLSLCFQGCETAADCQEGLACTAITEGDAKVCFSGCQATADCRSGQTCVGATAMDLGTCE